jgi:8-oxo-dGTP pyrophosphatase MutT (NUDIX family)
MSFYASHLLEIASFAFVSYVLYRRIMEVHLSSYTWRELRAAADDGNLKSVQWILTAVEKGYEGAGIIPYVGSGSNRRFVLGINKKGEAEYPGGKVERDDLDLIATAQREIKEETGLDIGQERFTTKCAVSGGTTGFQSHVFLLKLSQQEFEALKSKDGTFVEFVQVAEVVDPGPEKRQHVVDVATGKSYPIRKFNREYVLPQIKDFLLQHAYD